MAPTPLSAVQNAGSGRSFTLNATPHSLRDILDVVSAASRSHTRVRLTGVHDRSIEELVRIAVAGGDCVVFSEDRAPSEPAQARRKWFFG